jgi:uncharacterized protein
VIPLLLNVQEVLSRQQPVQLQGTLELTDLFRNSRDVQPLGPLKYEVTASPESDDRVGVTGSLTVPLRLFCSRCLNPIDEVWRFPFEEKFQAVEESDENWADDEDADAVPVSEDRIDLTPFLQEQVVVQLPYAPLCGDDCKGLCPECGANRNEQSCGCKTERADPRLAALQDWFKPEQEQ